MGNRYATALRATLLLAPAAACAQFAPTTGQSPQIYGRLDLSLNIQKIGDRGNQVAVSTDTSLLGFRMAEDLGGGNLAYVKLEHGFNGDTGADANAAVYWNREVFVGLSNPSFGAIELGTHWTPAIWLTGRTDPYARAQLGAQFTLLQGPAARGYATQFANSIEYITPKLGGLQARFLYQLREQAAANNRAFGIDYAAGNFTIGLAYDDSETTGASVGLPASVANTRSKNLGVGATYNFGPVKVFGYAQQNRVAGLPNVRGYDTGVAVPVGSGEVRAAYSHTNRPGAEASLLAVGYNHFLSKRTMVYTNIARLNNHGTAKFGMWPASQDFGAAAGPTAGQSTNGFQVGVRHVF